MSLATTAAGERAVLAALADRSRHMFRSPFSPRSSLGLTCCAHAPTKSVVLFVKGLVEGLRSEREAPLGMVSAGI